VSNENIEEQVKKANKELYDSAHAQYESVDGRRSPKLAAWLANNLLSIRKRSPGGSLLDLGAGSGFVARCASGIFEDRIGIDISQRILASNLSSFDLAVSADVDRLPFKDSSFDVVTCFAVLHHLYKFDCLVKEAARVLKPGGILYCDHDMDLAFASRFRFLLSIYRKLKNAHAKYDKLKASSQESNYALAEFHEGGVDTRELVNLLASNGFKVEVFFHWFGLNKVTDALFGTRRF
jgi:ubiquinone/menaquinone biosynthesis C-methylase UbiE